jgi:leader peptidase (prepilin peptidase) / N-methyltransferase
VLGLFLEGLILWLPQWVLRPYGDQIRAEDWQGPGGGLDQASRRSRQWTLALINGATWAACAYAMSSTATVPFAALVAWALCASTLLMLAVVDWNTTLLPDILVLSLLWAGLLASELEWTRVTVSVSVWSAAAWYAGPQFLAWLFERVTGRMGMGPGDAKLLAAMAAWWGWMPIFWALLIGSAWVVLWAFVGHHHRNASQAQIPFGPPLILGVCMWSLYQGLVQPF